MDRPLPIPRLDNGSNMLDDIPEASAPPMQLTEDSRYLVQQMRMAIELLSSIDKERQIRRGNAASSRDNPTAAQWLELSDDDLTEYSNRLSAYQSTLASVSTLQERLESQRRTDQGTLLLLQTPSAAGISLADPTISPEDRRRHEARVRAEISQAERTRSRISVQTQANAAKVEFARAHVEKVAGELDALEDQLSLGSPSFMSFKESQKAEGRRSWAEAGEIIGTDLDSLCGPDCEG